MTDQEVSAIAKRRQKIANTLIDEMSVADLLALLTDNEALLAEVQRCHSFENECDEIVTRATDRGTRDALITALRGLREKRRVARNAKHGLPVPVQAVWNCGR